jgi:hypothetical protein
MLMHVFLGKVVERLCQRVSVLISIKKLFRLFILLTFTFVVSDQRRGKLGQENGAPVSEHCSILLGASMLDGQVAVFDHATFEHDSARLVNWNALAAETTVIVSCAPVIVRDGLTLRRVNLLDVGL